MSRLQHQMLNNKKNLATLLCLCLSGNAISTSINNTTCNDKDIEMLNHLIDLKHPVSKSSLIHCFMKVLDSSFVYTKEMIDTGLLRWYKVTLNEVLVQENDMKLKTTDANTTVGK